MNKLIKNGLFYLFFTSAFFVSCTDAGKTGNQPATKSDSNIKFITDTNALSQLVDTVHTNENSLDWNGTYKGILPCAACNGLQTELVLNLDYTYTIVTREVTNKIEKSTTQNGSFVWIDATSIKLNDAPDNVPSLYFVGEDFIWFLDKEGKRISGDIAEKYQLEKQL